MESISAILFDWDGTLLDSFDSTYLASAAVFRHYGMAVDRERFLATYNPNWYETYRSMGLPRDEWAMADRIWLETYWRMPPELYPFAHTTLDTLHQNGYVLGLVTSGNRARVTDEIARHGLDGLFSALVCLEDTDQKKPDPAPLLEALGRMDQPASESVYVGDRPEDILMGRRAGSWTIGVESQYVTREILQAADPDFIFPDAGHIPRRFGPRSR